jgi:hypothetical protein
MITKAVFKNFRGSHSIEAYVADENHFPLETEEDGKPAYLRICDPFDGEFIRLSLDEVEKLGRYLLECAEDFALDERSKAAKGDVQ